jgi:hypothetical protein
MKWGIIENIVIYVLVIGGIIWSRTGWPLALLMFVNTRMSEKVEKKD